ncbi:MAG TPA: methylated-DNA--[protein]-cysteine S-methyltransferase [Solirubrobacteraceae bacterium]|jgi:methylated-DNA-[protein]-cysteine S-methyltransferase|nr:methylated-DNA--[protein]-cysteine S-methyltransferase [Solirubrobacteraceae bacterium]
MTKFEALLREGLAGSDLTGGDLPDISAALEASGHADLVYRVEESPVGPLLLAASERGLVCLHYVSDEGEIERSLTTLATRLTPRLVAGTRRLEQPRRELDEFFSGRRRDFEVPLDWALVKQGFTWAVLGATARIPFGETTSYKGIAGRAGNERAFRAAGTALGSNPLPIVIPCHRVLHSGGGLGGYTGGPDIKRRLLAIEGVLPGTLES